MTTLEARLSKLESLVASQQVVIESQAATIAQRDATIERLQGRVTELERKLGERDGGPPAGGGDSSPGRREPSGRKPGGQPGHKGHRRDLLPPERVTRTVECVPSVCRGCGEELSSKLDPRPLVHQVIDIPPIAADVTEYRRHRVQCRCGLTTCGQLPEGAPPGMMGPSLQALCALLAASCHVSRRKVQGLLSDLLGIRLSLGAISESEELVSDAVTSAVEEARQHAVAAEVKHADGTTWYQSHSFRALWTLATSAVTVFSIFPGGTIATLKRWMGETGVLVSDRGSQLSFWDIERRQLCWAHLIRKFAWYAEQRGEAGRLGASLLFYARHVMHEWHRVRDGTISRATFARNIRPARDTIEMMLDVGSRLDRIAGSCIHILEHRKALWRFASHGGVEPTNNHAEQELRGFVLWRKTSLGSRSARGDVFAANLKSVIHTCRKQRRHVLSYLTAAIHASLNHRSAPSLLATSP